jgi:hypothetical protein
MRRKPKERRDTMIPTRRLPPYGRRLREHGPRGTYWIAAGADAIAWAAEHEHLHALAAPPDLEPEARDWRLVAGSPPVVVYVAGELPAGYLDRLAAALLRDGAGRVLAITGPRDSIVYAENESEVSTVLSVPPMGVSENARPTR